MELFSAIYSFSVISMIIILLLDKTGANMREYIRSTANVQEENFEFAFTLAMLMIIICPIFNTFFVFMLLIAKSRGIL